MPRIVLVLVVALLVMLPGMSSAQDPDVPNWTRALAWSPDGSMIAVGTWYGAVRLVDETGQTLQVLQPNGVPILALDWSSDGCYVASGDRAGQIIIWDATTGNQVSSFSNYQAGSSSDADNSIDDLAWHPSESQLASASYVREQVVIRDVATGENVFETTTSETRSVAWNPDGRLLAIGGFDAIEIWAFDVSPNQPLNVLNADSLYMYILGLAWDSNGTRVASAQAYAGGDRYRIYIWDVSKNRLLSTYEVLEEGVSFSVSWSSNNRYIASASTGGVVRVWDTMTGQMFKVAEKNTRLFTVDWSPDGTRLAYGGEDGVLKFVDVPEDLAVK